MSLLAASFLFACGVVATRDKRAAVVEACIAASRAWEQGSEQLGCDW